MTELLIGSMVRYKGQNPLILPGRVGQVFNIDQDGVQVLWRSHVLQPYETLTTVLPEDLSCEAEFEPTLVAEVPPPQVQAPVIQTAPSGALVPIENRGHPYRGGSNPQLYRPPFPTKLLYGLGAIGTGFYTVMGLLQVLLVGTDWKSPLYLVIMWVILWGLVTPALWVLWQYRKW